MARNIKQDAACPDRRDSRCVPGGRAKIPEMRARRAAEPVVIRSDRHMGEGVDMGPRMRSRQNILAHVAKTCVVARPPGLGARDAKALGRAVGQDLKRRMTRKERHARKAIDRQGIELSRPRDIPDIEARPVGGSCRIDWIEEATSLTLRWVRLAGWECPNSGAGGRDFKARRFGLLTSGYRACPFRRAVPARLQVVRQFRLTDRARRFLDRTGHARV